MADGLLSDDDLGIGGAAPAPKASKLMSDADMGLGGQPEPSVGSAIAAPAVGFNKALADVAGAPVDFTNWIAGKAGLPVSDKPFGGSESIKSGLGYIGANPDEHKPQTGLESVLQGVGYGAGSVMLPEAGLAGMVRSGVRMAPAVSEGLNSALGSAKSVPAVMGSAGIGAAGGGLGQAASDVLPEPYKPYGQLVGGVIGGGLAASVPTLARQGAQSIRSFAQPMGAAGREQLAGSALRDASENVGNVRDALETAPRELVPGSSPTTFQLTGDMGLGALERKFQTANPGEFLSRRAEQNAARVGAVNGIQSAGSPEDVASFLRKQMNDADTRAQTYSDEAVSRAQTAAGNVGGTGTPEAYGADIRDAAAKAKETARQHRAALYKAVDPDNSLSLVASPVRERAEQLVGGIDPLAAQPTGAEAEILKAVQTIPDVLPFNSLRALDSHLSDAMRTERMANGESAAWGRLSQLKSSVSGAIDNGIANQVAYERDAAARGVHIDEPLESRIKAYQDAYKDGRAGSDDRANAGAASAASGAPAFAGVRGEEGAGGGGSGNAGGNPLMASGSAPGQLPLGTPGKITRPPQNLVSFLRQAGGIRDQGGELSSRELHKQFPGLVNNKSGMTLDQAREAAAERGFLGADADKAMAETHANDFLDALDSHPHYSVHDYDHLAAYQEHLGMQVDREKFRSASDEVRQGLAQSGTGNPKDRQLVATAANVMVRDGVPWAEAVQQAEKQYPRRPIYTDDAFPGDIPNRRLPPADIPKRPAPYAGPTPGEPNFDPAAADRLKAAKAAHADYAQTFKQGPVGDVLKSAGFSGQYRLPDAAVGAKAFVPGPRGFETAQAFRDAIGKNPEGLQAVQDYAAYKLRQAALRPDGTLDPKRVALFQTQHADALRAFPELSAKLSTAAKAADTVAEVMARRKQGLDDYQAGAIGKVMGVTDRQDVTRQIGSVFGQKNSVGEMRRLAAEAAKNPDAAQGLRKAIADHIADSFISNTEAATSGVGSMKADQFQTFVRKNRAALEQVFTPKEVDSMRAIAADLQRSNRSLNAVKIPGQSNTAQDLVAQGHAGHGETLLGKLWKAVLIGGEAGPLGAVSAAAGAVGQHILGGMRASGLNKVDDLIKEALLNPDVAQRLLSKAPIQSGRGSEISLGQALKRTALYSASNYAAGMGNSRRQRDAAPLTIHP